MNLFNIPSNELLQHLINGLTLGAIYSLIALGYTMVYGILKFINFAHGEILMAGTYAGYYFYFYAAVVGDLRDAHGWQHILLRDDAWPRAFVFSAQNLKLSWLFCKEVLVARSWPFWIAAGTQAIVSIALLAMVILSMRRRFKISW